MLETLDTIDWAHIHHSHGTAEKFPQWIRDLRSDDEKIRAGARDNLSEYSNHQQSIYEVSAYLVPFLIELAAAPDTPDRDLLLSQLVELAASSEAAKNIGEYGGDEEATYSNVMAGFDLYVSLLDDPNPDVRGEAAYIVWVFEEAISPQSSYDRLLNAVSKETHPRALNTMIYAVRVHLRQHTPLPTNLRAISVEERQMLRLVLDTELIWGLHGSLLAVYGLPVERAEARALLDAADAANNMGQPSPRTAT